MNEIISRLKALREVHLKISQDEFAKRLNLQRNTISLIENGKRNPSDRTLLDICREFNVNETWLRSGKGEIFNDMSREEELAEWAGRLVSSGVENEFIKKFVHILSKLDSSDWKALEKIALLMAQENKTE